MSKDFSLISSERFLNTEQSPLCLHIFHVTPLQNNEKQSSFCPSEFVQIQM